MVGVDLQERTRDRVTDRAELPGLAAAGDLDHRVEPPSGVRHGEWLERRLRVAVASEVLLERLLARRPEEVVRRAVRGMLPRNRLGEKMSRKLFVYAGPEHPHQAQRPETLAMEKR